MGESTQKRKLGNIRGLGAKSYNSCSHQDAVIKLHCGRVLKDILVFGLDGHDVIGHPLVGHLWEGVVDQASIQPSHKCTWTQSNVADSLTGIPVHYQNPNLKMIEWAPYFNPILLEEWLLEKSY